MPSRALLLASLLLLGAPAPGTSGSLPPSAPGERLEYQVDLGMLPAAAWVRIEALLPVSPADRSRLRLLAEVGPGPVMSTVLEFHYRLLSTVGLPAMLPEEGSRQIQEGEAREFAALTFDRAGGQVRESARAGGDPLRADPIEADTRDLLGALAYLRSLPPEREARFGVFENRRLYRVEAHPAGPDEIEVPAGRFRARRYRVDAQAAGGERPVREIDLWLSDDARRLPLKLQAQTALGLLVAHLTAAPQPSPAPR